VGLLERVSSQVARSPVAARPLNLSLDEYASWFSYGGANYPLLQTTYSGIDQERIAWTADAAAKRSGPVFALVLARMQVFSQIRFQWTRFTGAQPGDLYGTADLKVLERPWPGGVTADLLARMEWDASAAGQAYIRRNANTLHRLYPAWVTIAMGSQEDAESPWTAPDTTVAGYLWNPPSGKARFFTPKQICHYAPIPDPDRHFLGQSWITPVLRELQGDQASTEHKYRFFENAATPNLAIKFDPAIGIDMVRQFKELLETEYRGVANAYKTMFLGGGADPVTIGSSFKDMDYAVVQGRAESRLAAAAGVPPSWVGFAEGLEGSALNAGNFGAARRRFSDGTMAHLWGNVSSSLQQIMQTPPGASLWYDDRIPFMREDASDIAAIQTAEAATIAALIREGFEPNSVVKAVKNNDWTLLKHSGLVSVQLQPPGAGKAPDSSNGFPALAPAGANGNGNGNGART
jgi:hypothetical protein